MARHQYDLAVIGAGSTGLVAATTAARLGARVVLIERDRIGGDCTWTGCIPSKALIHAAAAAHQARSRGWLGDQPIDFGAVMTAVRAAVARVYEAESPVQLGRLGITVLMGSAEFTGPTTLTVDGAVVSAGRYLVCTGAEPAEPDIPGLDSVPHLTYLNLFELTALPSSLLVLGGGPIGCELAQALARLGSRVTIVDPAPRLLEVARPEASALIGEVFQSEGIKLLLNSSVARFEANPEGVTAHLGGQRLEAAAVLIATGRRPRTEGLGLAAAGIATGPQGILVDSGLATSNRLVHAAGDVAGSAQFTHYAAWQGSRAVRNALFPGHSRGRREGVPWAVFTDPVVAQVGAVDEAQGTAVARLRADRIDRAQAEDRLHGFLNLYSRRGRLVGAVAVAPGAGELINELSVAIDARLRMARLAGSIHVYPTYGFAIQQLAAGFELNRLTGGWRRPMLGRLRRGK